MSYSETVIELGRGKVKVRYERNPDEYERGLVCVPESISIVQVYDLSGKKVELTQHQYETITDILLGNE